jgi:hypothetical protein
MVDRQGVPFGSGLPGAGRMLRWLGRIADFVGLARCSIDDVSVWRARMSKYAPVIILVSGAILLKYGNVLPESIPFVPSQTHSSRSTIDRVPVLMLRHAAEAHGWDFGDDSLEGKDLSDGLRQAAMNGLITFWGRRQTGNSGTYARSGPLQVINRAHWDDYQFDFAPLSSATDNFLIFTYATRRHPPRRGGYVDIHVDRPQALKWLETGALEFKGRNDAARRR